MTQIEKTLIDTCQPELHFEDKIKNVSDDIFKWCPEGYYIRCVIINTNGNFILFYFIISYYNLTIIFFIFNFIFII